MYSPSLYKKRSPWRVTSALEAWNPWWAESSVPAALRGRPRTITKQIEPEMDLPEVMALTGIRRSGKTTIIYQLIQYLLDRGTAPKAILYANMEDPGLDPLSHDDLAAAFPDDHSPRRYMFLDEVQERSDWERWLRVQYDRKVPIKFIVSGSSSDMTHGDYARLLTGRNLTHTIGPMDFNEYMGFVDSDDSPFEILRNRFMPHGGFPEPNLRDPHAGRALLEQYFQDILNRDLVGRRNLDPDRVERLAIYLAQAFGGPHTKRRVANATHLAPDTLRSYLEAMQNAYLIQIVPRFTDSPKPSRETEAPFKVYWADTGLRNSVVPDPGRDIGTQAENLVAVALAKKRRPYYWTDGTGRHEVDFILPRDSGALDAYQVWYDEKATTWNQVPERELEGFTALKNALPGKRQGSSILVTATLSGKHDGVQAIPLHDWLMAKSYPGKDHAVSTDSPSRT